MSDRVKIILDVPADFATHIAGALEVGADSGSPDLDEHISSIAEGITDGVNAGHDTYEFVLH